MEKNSSCPLDGSWMRDHCVTYEGRKKDGSLEDCQHRSSWANTRATVESNANESVATAKKVLIGRIPDIFQK